MSQAIISVEGLGKRYSLRHQTSERYTALRDVLTDKAKNLFRRNGRPLSTLSSELSKEDFWALKNVSFEVKQGEVLGIIGRNGAGKSTLLKILSRITDPTEGKVRIRGRVASLLEVGTGFHPELTGRENIFLNGAILGMTKAEIKAKFDAIVAFAETEKFLDTPVKRYSSGMYVRLAFAVAAHLEPEILIVDEVLAVGDAQFQKKCLGKMGEIASQNGRTVLFVSHNMPAIQNLSSRAILLVNGSAEQIGSPAYVVTAYLRAKGQLKSVPLSQRLDRQGSGEARIVAFKIDGSEYDQYYLGCGSSAVFTLVVQGAAFAGDLSLHVAIYNTMDIKVAHLASRPGALQRDERFSNTLFAECIVPWLSLSPGSYFVNVGIVGEGRQVDRIENVAQITVTPSDAFGTGWMGSAESGAVSLMNHHWRLSEDE